jgi:hypothetical protein
LKKKTKKWLYRWLGFNLFAMSVAGGVFLLAWHKPAYYLPAEDKKKQAVDTYLTHELIPDIYNKSQFAEPFEVIVLENRLDELTAEFNWPLTDGSVTLQKPSFFFETDHIFIVDEILIANIPFVLTIGLCPQLVDSEQNAGYINLNIISVKVGALEIKPLALAAADRFYTEAVKPVIIDAGTRDMIEAIIANKSWDAHFTVRHRPVFIQDLKIDPDFIKIVFCGRDPQ